jgi:Tfp pilus assembly protein PilX
MTSSRGNDSGFVLLDALLFLILVTVFLLPVTRIALDMRISGTAVVEACLDRFGVENPER